MEVEIAKVSSKGQVVIPSNVRKMLGIKTNDRFLVFGKDDTVLLKKIEKTALEKTFDEIAGPIRREIKKSGLNKKDLDRLIHETRAGK
ncbi:AbrB/MazE/SpoVT family DNA-binding domain-containing protein [archaeon]|nr:AbrB/MazE/SpoVT family DNA-binding domain-containing protein [archaeon]